MRILAVNWYASTYGKRVTKRVSDNMGLIEKTFAPGFSVQGQVLFYYKLACMWKMMIAVVEVIGKFDIEGVIQ
jgi:hypothetical protein